MSDECITRPARPCETPWHLNPWDYPCGDRANIALYQRRRARERERTTKADRQRSREYLLASKCPEYVARESCVAEQRPRVVALRKLSAPSLEQGPSCG